MTSCLVLNVYYHLPIYAYRESCSYINLLFSFSSRQQHAQEITRSEHKIIINKPTNQ